MILADTGYWVALLNRTDRHHERALEVSAALKQRLVTTWPVLTECTHLLSARAGAKVARQFLERCFAGAVQLAELRTEERPRILELMARYASLPMDLADASLVVLAERLGDGRILSTDQRDFESYRWKNTKPFQNLLLP
jgi:predicted nucleic acid-binding protein